MEFGRDRSNKAAPGGDPTAVKWETLWQTDLLDLNSLEIQPYVNSIYTDQNGGVGD